MGSSLACLRQALQAGEAASHSLILGCDQPALDEAHLGALMFASVRRPDRVVVSTFANVRGIPVVVPNAMWFRYPLHGDRGLRDLLATERERCIPISQPDLAHDLDTPEDVCLAEQRKWLDPLHPAYPLAPSRLGYERP